VTAPLHVDAGALARKYAALVALRRRRDTGGDAAGGGTLRALAAEFPGCLRELDTLGGAELARRASACEAAASGGQVETWMPWIAAYHETMRLALRIRADDPDADAVADPAFAAAVRSPPGGRVGVVVLRALAARFGTPAAAIAAALFPVRRPSPYEL